MAHIRLSDIDYQNQTIKVVGKGNKLRMLPVPLSVLNDIKLYAATRYTGYLFASRYKNKNAPMKLASYNNICMKAGNLAGIKNPNPNKAHINPYIFRHSYARIAKDRGMSFEALQNIMGHSSFVTTMDMYGTMSLDDIKKDSECMAFI